MASDALAGGFAIREQSAFGQGASFAGVAAGGESISGMFWNPAVITQHSDRISESHFAVILPQSDVTIDPSASTGPGGAPLGFFPGGIGSTSTDIGQAALVPASYASSQVGDRLFIGLAINSPFGLVTDPADFWAGRFHAQTSDVLTINFNPVVAFKLSEMISIAAGLQVNYLDVRLKSISFVPALGVEFVTEIKGDDIGVGATAGITITPMPGTTIGIGYRSRVEHTLEGSGRVGPIALGPITGDITLPDMVTIGLRHQINEYWTVLAGIEWANWSEFADLTILFSAPPAGFPPASVTIEDWDDSWFFSLGAERMVDESLTVRGGVAFEESPVPDATRTPRVPDNDRVWLSLGASWKARDWLTFDAAYTHIFVDDAPIRLSLVDNPTRGALTGSSDASVDIISFSLRMNWDAEGSPLRRLFN